MFHIYILFLTPFPCFVICNNKVIVIFRLSHIDNSISCSREDPSKTAWNDRVSPRAPPTHSFATEFAELQNPISARSLHNTNIIPLCPQRRIVYPISVRPKVICVCESWPKSHGNPAVSLDGMKSVLRYTGDDDVVPVRKVAYRLLHRVGVHKRLPLTWYVNGNDA